MDNNNDPLRNIVKYSQVLLSDGMLARINDSAISTEERKNLVKSSISLIRDNLAEFEEELTKLN